MHAAYQLGLDHIDTGIGRKEPVRLLEQGGVQQHGLGHDEEMRGHRHVCSGV